MLNPIEVDYLIIGSGIAGLTAAKELSQSGTVAILSKGPIKEGSTSYAQGGIAVALQEDDKPSHHFTDTLEAGAGLCDEEHVTILVEEGVKAVEDLITMGAQFDTKDGEIDFGQEAAHKHRRILHAGDTTGREIEKTLGNSLLEDPNITFYPNTSLLDLMVYNNECEGCIAEQEGELILFTAKTTMIATGGCAQTYKYNSNPRVITGDGLAIAYENGAILEDMEFVQFHPTTLYQDNQRPVSLFLISEAVRGEGGILKNSKGETFMGQYHPDAELAPRDIVTRAIFAEMEKEKSNHVFLDLTQLDIDLEERFPTIYNKCKEAGIDPKTDLIPVAPAAHYTMGGIKTNKEGETSINRLFAAGEAAALGLHGANRLASNSLLDGLVFGRRAGLKMKSYNSATNHHVVDHIKMQFLENQESLNYVKNDELAQKVKAIMWEKVGIIRHEEGLTEAMEDLMVLSQNFPEFCGDSLTRSIKSLTQCAKLITQFALERCESRGAHFRSDYPDRDDQEWARHQARSAGAINT